MTDHELLQAIGQVIEAKMEPMRQDIHELKEDVRVLKNDVRRLEGEVQTLKDGFQTLSGEVRTLKDGFQTLSGEVESQKANFARLEKKVDDMDEKLFGIRVYIDSDLKRTLNLLLEGQQAVWDHAVAVEAHNALSERTDVLELTARRHSREIRELQDKLA